MKVLFIHNSVPEYRLELWRILSGMVELQLLITDKDCERKAYGFQKDESGLNISYLTLSNYQQWLQDSYKFNVVVLSPVDSKRDYHICKDFVKAAKTGNAKVVGHGPSSHFIVFHFFGMSVISVRQSVLCLICVSSQELVLINI